MTKNNLTVNLKNLAGRYSDAVAVIGNTETVPYRKNDQYYITISEEETPDDCFNVALQLAYILLHDVTSFTNKITFADIASDQECCDFAEAILITEDQYVKATGFITGGNLP